MDKLKKTMPIQLNKVLYDVSREKVLYPNNRNGTQEEINEAWARVAKANMLSVHEARSIYKILINKYEQEKERDERTWKLFDLMDAMHKTPLKDDSDTFMEDDEEYEMLEVQEDDETAGNAEGGSANNSASEGDNSGRSSNGANDSPEKNEKLILTKPKSPQLEERKLSNSVVLTSIRNPTTAPVNQQQQQQQHSSHQQKSNISSKAQSFFQHKGITLRKAPSTNAKSSTSSYCTSEKKEKTTIQLPEAIKRKLSENATSKDAKKINFTIKRSLSPPRLQGKVIAPVLIKTEREEEYAPGTVITIPANGGVSTSSSNNTNTSAANGFSASIQEIDFSKDIIFETNSSEVSGTKSAEIINLGNETHGQGLTPIFFKNLCNSSRHEAFGLYVANIMNRLSKPAAAKLEVQILRSVTNILSEESDS